MHAFTFSKEVVAEIRHDRYHHPHPRVQRKLEVLWLRSQGLTHAEIAAFADVSPRSVQHYLDQFEQEGLGVSPRRTSPQRVTASCPRPVARASRRATS
jgi:hypothetical protein